MRFSTAAAALAVLVCGLSAREAVAKRVAIRIVPTATRAVTADAVVVGKVTSVEPDTVDAAPAPGAEKVAHKVAVIKVDSAISGAKGLTHVKVGFPAAAGGEVPGGRPGRGGFGPIALTADQEGCFFLTKHPTAGFYVIHAGYTPLDAKADTYKAELESVTKAAAVAADPAKALKADKADDRFTAAAVLVSKYRTYPQGAAEVENVKVPAEVSKAIIDALVATDDWGAVEPVTGQTASGLAQILAIGPDEGFRPKPFTGNGDYNVYFRDEFKAWAKAVPKDFAIRQMVRKDKK